MIFRYTTKTGVCENTRCIKCLHNQIQKFLNPVIGQPAWDYWGLTESVASLRRAKKSSPWAQWENTATPLSILAHYADPDTRQRYARIEAELDQWRFNQTMEYQRVYNREREIVNAAYQMAWEKRTFADRQYRHC